MSNVHFTLYVGGCGAGEAFAKYCGFNFVECKIHVSPGHRYQPDWTVQFSYCKARQWPHIAWFM